MSEHGDRGTVDLKARVSAAIAELNKLCNGEPFRMRIPVQDTDSDQIIGAALLNISILLAENERLQRVIEAAREIVADADRPQLARNWATDRLAAALAAIEEAGE